MSWTVLDVNEGDAMLLECDGEAMMVDSGEQAFRERVRAFLEEKGLQTMKYWLLTHDHGDHIDGFYYLLGEGFRPETYVHGYTPWEMKLKDNGKARRTMKRVEELGIPVMLVGHGDTLTLGGAKIEVLRYSRIVEDKNVGSLVLRVEYGQSSLLLCADISGMVQKEFFQTIPEKINADIIKTHHHGITPIVPEFRKAVSPDAYVVTNRRRDVHPNMASFLRGTKDIAFCSGDGTVHAVTDGTDWYIWQEK